MQNKLLKRQNLRIRQQMRQTGPKYQTLTHGAIKIKISPIFQSKCKDRYEYK